MKDYGTLHELNGRYILKFEQFFSVIPEDVFFILTSPEQLYAVVSFRNRGNGCQTWWSDCF
ncbi:hypothetical protein ACH0B6_10130 [Solibacillus silvestris]